VNVFPMNKSEENWFVSERAEMMAVLALTRLPEVTVRRHSEDYGLDLLVSVSEQRNALITSRSD
jgi:hypothetical protein